MLRCKCKWLGRCLFPHASACGRRPREIWRAVNRYTPFNHEGKYVMKTAHTIMFLLSIPLLANFAAADRISEPDDILRVVQEWRIENIPATCPDSYWSGLKALGARMDEAAVNAIGKMVEQNLDTMLAVIAFNVRRNSEKVNDIVGWYGVYQPQVSRERRGIPPGEAGDKAWERLQGYWRMPRVWKVEQLRDDHLTANYAPIWHAWLLAPSQSEPILRSSIPDALKRIKDPGSFVIAAEMFREAVAKLKAHDDPEEFLKMNEEQLKETSAWLDLVYNCNLGDARSTLLLYLDWFRIARRHGFAETGGIDSLRSRLVRLFSSRDRFADLSREELEKFLKTGGGSGNIEQALIDLKHPFNDRWKEFKPVIEDMLRDPEANGLDGEDIRLWRDALAAMPKE